MIFRPSYILLCAFLYCLLPPYAVGQQKADTLKSSISVVTTQLDSSRTHIEIDAVGKKEKKELTQRFYFFVAGFSILMAISLLFKSFINNWDRANLYAALMFFFNFMNVWMWTDAFPIRQIGSLKIGALGLFFNQIVPVFTLLLYRTFLNIKNERPILYKFITVSIGLLLFFNGLMLVQILVNKPFIKIRFEYVFEIIFLITQFLLPFAFLRYWRHPIFRFATWSSWVIALSFLLYFLISYSPLHLRLPFGFDPAFILFMALMIDGILFLFALTVRDRQMMIEKIRLEQQATISELKALRSQMNPHFIFNCLNAIKSYTLNQDTEGANFYLTKFSKLMRQVLENSRNEKVTLSNELETLSLYMDMEKLRAGDKFNYKIQIAEDIEGEFIEVPPMLIQPYVENAIWHGLMQKEGIGQVSIQIHQKEDKKLIIIILDNGIGREQAAILKSKTAMRHKSFGMQITAERMDIIRDLYKIDTSVTIEDLKNTEGVASGTRVTLEIPL